MNSPAPASKLITDPGRRIASLGGAFLVQCYVVAFFVFLGEFAARSVLAGAETPTPTILEIIRAFAWSSFFVIACNSLIAFRLPDAVSRSVSRLVSWAAISVVALSILLYLSSWYLFSRTGSFVDRSLLQIGVIQPRQIANHLFATGGIAFVIVYAAIAIALGGLRTYLHKRRADRPPFRTEIATAGWGLLAASVLLIIGSAETIAVRPVGPADTLAASFSSSDSRGVFETISHKMVRPRIPRDSVATETPKADGMRRLNVIYLLVESLRPDQLVSYGGTRSVMPTVDKLADQSWRFRNAYSQASHSDYADLSGITSLYPLRKAKYEPNLSDDDYPKLRIYDLLKRQGYRTAIFSAQNEYWGGMYYGLESKSLDVFYHAATSTGSKYAPASDKGFFDFVERLGNSGKIDDGEVVAKAIKWIGQGASPFYIYMNLQRSHIPYTLPKGVAAKFLKEPVDFYIGMDGYPRDKIGLVKDKYADSLNYIDSCIARLVAHLQRSGQWDNTILIIAGDTGQAFYEHGYPAHGYTVFNEMVRKPLLIRVPDGIGTDVFRNVEDIDVPPSILDLLGLPEHPGFQGTSVFTRSSMKPVFTVSHMLGERYAVIQGDWKLVRDFTMNKTMLFNLRADPGEINNLSYTFPAEVEALSSVLSGWIEEQLGYYRQKRYLAEFPPRYESSSVDAKIPTQVTSN